ncbi:MAG: GNAT family N-acetyltransferase [Myxococcota bacterium]
MRVRAAEDADRPAMRRLLEEAFAEDPFVGWLTSHQPRRRRAYVRLVLDRLAWRRGCVELCEGPGGALCSVAVWMPPGTWELTLVEQLRLLPAVFRAVGSRRFGDAAAASERVERQRPTAFWYLALVGTASAHRGRGHGRAVLTPGLARARAAGVPALLDTGAEVNLGFYTRLGFVARRQVRLPSGGPLLTTLERV